MEQKSVTAENGTLNGVIYKLPFAANPPAASLVEFHRYTLATGLPAPDGIAFGKSGKLYVALAGTSQISVLRPDGSEEVRYSGPAANPGGSPKSDTLGQSSQHHFRQKDRLATGNQPCQPGAIRSELILCLQRVR